jgi:hypothetical protein
MVDAALATRAYVSSANAIPITITTATTTSGDTANTTGNATTTPSTSSYEKSSVRGINNAKNTHSTSGTPHPNTTSGSGLQPGKLHKSGMVASLHTHNLKPDPKIRNVTATGPTFKPVFHPKPDTSTSHTNPQFGRLSTTVDRTTTSDGGITGTTSDSRDGN